MVGKSPDVLEFYYSHFVVNEWQSYKVLCVISMSKHVPSPPPWEGVGGRTIYFATQQLFTTFVLHY